MSALAARLFLSKGEVAFLGLAAEFGMNRARLSISANA
jgi:hypothetical protein